ncbi:hypothetical protein DKX38_027863 [Salix brachista]|uniref:Ammonium transporter AmtB-like domain-containing protein n=1 Tax=Salix brachista TaxID=2182728 RepID=A0A5N5JFY6_9ROSI|nr:hypothetical protein DKX38_027863 [Salix brachista]
MSNDTAFPSNLMPDEASTVWFNKADNAWQLTAATLVGLQSIPGLMISIWWSREEKMAGEFSIYGTLCICLYDVCWVTWGYRMSFGSKILQFWGEANVALDQNYLLEQAFLGKFPNATMVYFPSVFAAITLTLIAGVVLGQMDFYAWMMSVPLWLTFSLGGILTGVFAEPKLNRLFFGASACYIGLFYGFVDKSRIGSGVRQIGVQFMGGFFPQPLCKVSGFILLPLC